MVRYANLLESDYPGCVSGGAGKVASEIHVPSETFAACFNNPRKWPLLTFLGNMEENCCTTNVSFSCRPFQRRCRTISPGKLSHFIGTLVHLLCGPAKVGAAL